MKTFKDLVIATIENMVVSDNSSKTLFNDTVSLLIILSYHCYYYIITYTINSYTQI